MTVIEEQDTAAKHLFTLFSLFIFLYGKEDEAVSNKICPFCRRKILTQNTPQTFQVSKAPVCKNDFSFMKIWNRKSNT